MKEEFLHYVWRSKQFQHLDFTTTQGDKLRVEFPGNYNENQGPDFLFARIYFNEVLWIGHLEMHVKASDWYRHKHENDEQYKNCILHVVWENDEPIYIGENELPCLALKNYIDISLIDRYESLMSQLDNIACSHLIKNVPGMIIGNQLERSMLERLEHKTDKVYKQLAQLHGDWEALIAYNLLSYLLAPVNQKAAERLSQNLSWKIIIKLRNNKHILESFIFGIAGFLQEDLTKPYSQSLKKEYDFLCKKYNCKKLELLEWKYSRLRPAHFPEIRLAQWISLIHREPNIFSKLLECKDYKDFTKVLENPLEGYWKNHYSFRDEPHKHVINQTGKATMDILIINAVVPVLFAFGQQQYNEQRQVQAMKLLEQISAEKNKYTRYWEQKMIACRDAFQSQALIQQMTNYCDEKRCLECQIGHYIMQGK